MLGFLDYVPENSRLTNNETDRGDSGDRLEPAVNVEVSSKFVAN
jgi:hypothetical protein